VSISEAPSKMSSSTYGHISVESLPDVVGFDTTAKRIGDFGESKKIEEAIVCIPFITVAGNRHFFDVELNSQEYVAQLALLNKYIFPPTFDFLTNQDVNPIAFYAFEFSMDLSQDDLINIWQNLPPDSSTSFEKRTSTIQIRALVDKLLANDQDLQWMVFKVKRRAEKDFNILTRRNLGGGTPIIQPSIDSPYSYNWPYDYFSFVELVKIDSDVIYATEDIITEEEEPVVVPELREFIPTAEELTYRVSPPPQVLEMSVEAVSSRPDATGAQVAEARPARRSRRRGGRPRARAGRTQRRSRGGRGGRGGRGRR